MNTRRRYQVIESDTNIEEHKSAAIRVWGDNFPRMSNPSERFDWLFRRNPAGRGWMYHLVDQSSQGTVGTLGISARRFHNRDSDAMIGLVADYAIDAKHRTLGPALEILKRAASEGLTHFAGLYGFPNKKAQPVFKRAGFRLAGRMVRFGRLRRTEGFLSKRVSRIPARAISTLLDAGIALVDTMHYLTLLPRLRFEHVSTFGEEFDELWREAARGNDLFMCERTSSYLSWRFGEAYDECDYKTVVAVDRKTERMVGYVVYFVTDDGVCHVADLLSANIEKDLRALLVGFMAKAKRDIHESVSFRFCCGRELGGILRWLGFVERGHRPVFFAAGEDTNCKLEDAFLTLSDQDTI